MNINSVQNEHIHSAERSQDDEQEFEMLQTLHLEALNYLSNDDSRTAAETRAQFKKSLLEGINNLKKELRKRDACVLLHLLPKWVSSKVFITN